MIIRLDGEEYQVDAWRGKDVVDFSPRASVPGGSIVHSELGLYQPIVQTDWEHGFGFHWHRDESGYLRTDGRIDTRHDGLAMLWTAATQDDVDASNRVDGFVNFNGDLYAWGEGGLYRLSGGSWSNVYSSAAVNWAIATGTYLFYAPDGARIRKVDTSNTHTVAGTDSNSTDFAWLEISEGYIYAGKDDSNVIHFDSSEDLSALEGSTSSDTAEIYAGMNGIDTIRALGWAGKLNIGKPDGLYQLSQDNQIARRVLKFPQSSDNFRFLVDYNGLLAFPIKSRIYTWNGSNTQDLTPSKISDSFPYTTYGRFDNAVAMDRWLVVSARTSDSTYEEHILAWDGVGWHKLAEAVTNGSDRVSAIHVDTDNDRLWYAISDAGGTAHETYYVELQTESEFPFANFPTSGTHSLITSRISAGFRWVTKSMISLDVEGANLDSGTYLDVKYQIDSDGTWVDWEIVTSDGHSLLEDPGGDLTREFNHINLRFDFVTDDSSNTPVLEGFTMKLLLRPDEAYGYTFDIPARSYGLTGMKQDHRSVKDIKDALREARGSKDPVELETPYGETIFGYVTAINEDAVEWHPEDARGEPNIETNIRVSFVEVPELTGG